MADLTSFITIAPSNNTIFTNAINNDMLVYTESKTQSILIGTMSNVPAALGVTSNTVSIGATVVPITDVTYDLGTSNKRFRDIYLSGNTIDLGGTLLKKDNINGALVVTDSNGNYNSVIVSQIQVGNSSNVVTIQLDSNNQVQFVATTLSNGQSTGSNVSSVGGWSNIGSNLVVLDSNVGIGKSNPAYSIDTAGDINFDGGLYKNGAPYIGSQWSNDSINVFILDSNVGIGTMNPFELFEVAGNAKIESNAYIMSNAGIRTAFPNEALEVYNGNALIGCNMYVMSNLGIGKSNPAFALDVTGDLNFTGTLRQSGVPYIGSQWSNNSSNIFVMGSNIGIYTQTPSEAIDIRGSNMKVGCNLYVMSNIGIGKSNPAYPLDVNGAIYAVGYCNLLSNTYTSASTSNAPTCLAVSNLFTIVNFTSNTSMWASNTGFYASNTAVAGSNAAIYSSNTANWASNTGLYASNTAVWASNATSTAVAGSNSAVWASNAAVYGSNTANAASNAAIYSSNTANAASNTAVAASNRSYNTWKYDASNIYISSNVGIYTQTPSEALDISGSNAKVGCNLYVMSNVGIGKSNPSYSLDTAGDINFEGILRQNGVPYIGSQWSNNSSNVFITGSNIGIGLSNPTAALSIAGDLDVRSNILLTNQQLVFRGVKILKNSNMAPSVTNVTSAITSIPGYSYGSSNHLFITTSNNYFSVTNGSSETMRVMSNMVGIGTQVPTSILHLASNAATNVLITMCNTATGGSPATFGLGSTGDVSLTTASNNNLTFSTSNVERLRINSNGFVGIGTSSPASALHLNSNASANVLVTFCNAATAGRPASIGLATTGDMSITIASNNNLVCFTSNAERMRVTSNGFVGIGTTNPSYLLDVNGNGRINGNLYYSNTGAYVSSSIGTYGTVSVSGYAKASWYGYDINSWCCLMAYNNTSIGLHDNTYSWIFLYEKSDTANRYCSLYWGNGSANSERLRTTSYGVSIPNTLYMGTANFNINTWHTSSDTKNRFYFGNNSHTYFGSPDTWRFQHSTNGDVCVVAANGSITNNGVFNNFTISGNRITLPGGGDYGWSGLLLQTGDYGHFGYGHGCLIAAYNTSSAYSTTNKWPLYIQSSGVTISDSLAVGGTLSKGGGSFDIVHPDPSKASKGYHLRHCFVESPTRGDNIYTFKITTTENKQRFTIDLPDYFSYLNENPRAFISCEEEDVLSHCCAKVNNDLTQVKGMCELPATYTIMVIGTRKDQMMIDYFDNNGGVEYILKQPSAP